MQIKIDKEDVKCIIIITPKKDDDGNIFIPHFIFNNRLNWNSIVWIYNIKIIININDKI